MGTPLNELRKGDTVLAKHGINPAQASRWTFARECDPIMGNFAPRSAFTVADVRVTHPNWVKLQMPARQPPAFIKLSGSEFSSLFEARPTQPTAPPALRPNLQQLFQKLSQRQKAVREGLMAMQDARAELKKDISSGQNWGLLAVMANATMLPLNIIINAFGAGNAASTYQRIVKLLYENLGRSGTRINNSIAKEGLGKLKKEITEELTRKGLTRHIPGVNIIVGMAEDGVAFMEAVTMVSAGSSEMARLLAQTDAKIAAAQREFGNIGIEMERLLTKMDTIRRTA